MISRRALVVTDSFGVLEVFGPYSPEELSGPLGDLEVWAGDSRDEFVEVEDVPLRDPDTLQQWIEDPEGFYGVGDEVVPPQRAVVDLRSDLL